MNGLGSPGCNVPMQALSGSRLSIAEADHTTIAAWIEQFRMRMKRATVRYLTSQDSQVLGAELYTSQAFSQLLKRAHAITEDISREAKLLDGDEESSPLAHQLAALINDMLVCIRDLNEMAGAVHKIAMERMRKMEESKTEGDPSSWLRVFRSLQDEKDPGITEADSLWSLVSLSGILGDFSINSFLNDDPSNKDGDRMRQFL